MTDERVAEYATLFGWGYDYDQNDSYFLYDKDGEQHIMVEYDGTITAEAMLDALRWARTLGEDQRCAIRIMVDNIMVKYLNGEIDDLPASVVEAVYQAAQERG